MATDQTAASYGIFQVAYAALDQGLTNSLVSFLRSRNESLAVALVALIPFGRRLQALEALATALDQDSEYVQHLRAALALAGNVSKWRNARVHPHVEFLDGIRPVLVNKDGSPLQIDAKVCWEKIRQSSAALSELDAYTDRLVSDVEILDGMMNVELE
jgi:hypothetical protein